VTGGRGVKPLFFHFNHERHYCHLELYIMRRVVITGVGSVSPLGCGNIKNWDALISGKSGIGLITRFDTSDLTVKIAGGVYR
jgi:hypothetical protein